MLVARSYSSNHSADKSPPTSLSESSSPSTRPQKDDIRSFGWRPKSFKNKDLQEMRVFDNIKVQPRSRSDTSQQSINPHTRPVPSKPVSVPSRSSVQAIGRAVQVRDNATIPHDSKSLPPSVAALLAMTAIPPKKSFTRSKSSRSIPKSIPERISGDELIEEWKQWDLSSAPLTGSSPTMDFLLSSPADDETFDVFLEDGDLHKSTSNDSIPSLDADVQSDVSWSFSTPEASVKDSASNARRERTIAVSKSIESDCDHPLLMRDSRSSDDDEVDQPEARSLKSSRRSSRSAQSHRSFGTSSLKSNLTASITAIRSAARSFSNFAAPSLLPADHLSQGFLGMPYRPEMRPRPLTGVVTPEFRRYLNPHAFHLHENNHIDHNAELDSTSSILIPLRTYELVANRNPAESAPDRLLATELELDAGRETQQRQREPRENDEFLRIFALETLMRREGKLEPLTAGSGDGMEGGRRAFWLPPREVRQSMDEELSIPASTRRGRKVPRRWRGLSAYTEEESV